MSTRGRTIAIVLLASLATSATCSQSVPVPEGPIHTEGTGTVTVLFEAGLGDTGEVWRSVQSSVADRCARTVSYTRVGHGAGSAAGPRDAVRIVAELRDRLAESGVSPPYVLVGHSAGGLYMQYFARRYPSEVRGLLLVDSMHWNQLARVREATPAVLRMMEVITSLRGGITRREFAGFPSTAVAIGALPVPHDVPTIVLSGTRPAIGAGRAFRALAARLQNELADAYATRRHEFVADSGHYIQRDQPRAVIRAACELAGCAAPTRPVGPGTDQHLAAHLKEPD